MRVDYPYPQYAEIGRIEADHFDPPKWKPDYPNAAFDRMLPDDAFWAARIVARFSDEAIRAIVATETGKGVETFNKRLEGLARKLDVVAEQTASARFDEIGERIDELGRTLTERIDRGAANVAPLEALIASLAKNSVHDGASCAKPVPPSANVTTVTHCLQCKQRNFTIGVHVFFT